MNAYCCWGRKSTPVGVKEGTDDGGKADGDGNGDKDGNGAQPQQHRHWRQKSDGCSKPFNQPRDAAQREECSDLDEKSLTTFVSLRKGKKDLLESTKMDFNET